VTSQTPEQEKARRQVMTGVMVTMGACVFGGLLAVVLVALGQRTAAIAMAIVAGAAIAVGLAIQGAALRRLKAATEPGSKPPAC
jgi:purine-cytosine permease-like protein